MLLTALSYGLGPYVLLYRLVLKPLGIVKSELDGLLADVGTDKLHLVAVDVTEKTDVAREWGVTTVPSIYVIDPAGRVAHVNNGFTSELTLRRQVS